MRTGKRDKKWSIFTLTALAAGALLLWPVMGNALPVCTTPISTLCDTTRADYATSDCDGDGLTDKQECEGFVLTGGRAVNGVSNTATDKLDPSKPDLFYMVTDMNGNEVTTGSLMYQALGSDPNSNSALKFYSSGLKITTHRIKATELVPGTDRGVTVNASGTPTVKAAWIRENMCNPKLTVCPESTALGSTPESKPTDQNVYSIIYTQKIKNNVDTNCLGKSCSVAGTTANNSGGTDNTPIVNYYILQVTAHEMGHGSRLSTEPSTYYHYSKSGTVMDPAATFSRGVYTIPTNFDPVKDPTAVTLK